MCLGAAQNCRFPKFWAYAHMGGTFLFQFPVIHFGLAHSGSWPFNYPSPTTCNKLSLGYKRATLYLAVKVIVILCMQPQPV